jgi:hypothetical protein
MWMKEGVMILLLESLLIRKNGEGVLHVNSMLKKMEVVCILLAGKLVLVCDCVNKHDYEVIIFVIMRVICF